MRYIWLVGLREFLENARTKGFWIGIFLFPVIILVSGSLPVLLAKKGVSTRHYVMIDQSGEFAPLIRSHMDRRRASDPTLSRHNRPSRHIPSRYTAGAAAWTRNHELDRPTGDISHDVHTGVH